MSGTCLVPKEYPLFYHRQYESQFYRKVLFMFDRLADSQLNAGRCVENVSL